MARCEICGQEGAMVAFTEDVVDRTYESESMGETYRWTEGHHREKHQEPIGGLKTCRECSRLVCERHLNSKGICYECQTKLDEEDKKNEWKRKIEKLEREEREAKENVEREKNNQREAQEAQARNVLEDIERAEYDRELPGYQKRFQCHICGKGGMPNKVKIGQFYPTICWNILPSGFAQCQRCGKLTCPGCMHHGICRDHAG